MKYILLLPIFLLAGCWQSVNQNDIETAIRICGGIEHVVQIDANFLGGESAVCSDRTEIFMRTRSVMNDK